MTYNIIGYISFLGIIYFVTIHLGWLFYKHGEVYLHMMLPNDSHLVESINKILLVAYYLFNIGFATYSISSWSTIHELHELIYYVSYQAGKVILILAIAHYFNMTWIMFYSKYIAKNKEDHPHQINV